MLNSTHDVFLVLIDSAFAFELPDDSAGWIRGVRRRDRPVADVVAPRRCASWPARARAWQDDVQRMAKDADLDVLRFGIDELASAVALSEFIAERRLRKS